MGQYLFLRCWPPLVLPIIMYLGPAARAQADGAPPFACAVDSVMFSNGPVHLAGAFLKPAGAGPFPAVVIAHGAGPSTFDEPAFRVHANAFVRGGFAVLLYDKRGSGRSIGDLDTSDYDDLAADLAAGVTYLRARRDITPTKIGVLGRSEGGWVGTLAASRDSLLAFVILSSGSGVGPYDQTLFATRAALQARGASQREVEEATAAKAAQWEYYRRVATMDPVAARTTAMQAERDSLEKQLRLFARFAPVIPQNIRDPARTPHAFYRAFTHLIYYDPVPALRSAHAALLEVIGENDEVVEPSSTIAAFERLGKERKNVAVRMLPGVGHPLIIMSGHRPRYPDDYPEFTVRWAATQIGAGDR